MSNNKQMNHDKVELPRLKQNLSETDNFYIDIYQLKPFDALLDILQLGVEMHSDYTCEKLGDIARVRGNYYSVNLEDVYKFYENPSALPLAFARCFVDEGMRVFPDTNRIIVESTLDLNDFVDKLETIIHNKVITCSYLTNIVPI